MYDLFTRVPTTLELLKACLIKVVRSIGTAIVQDQENIKVQ